MAEKWFTICYSTHGSCNSIVVSITFDDCKCNLGIVLTTRRRDAIVLPSRDLRVSCWRTIHIFVWPSCEMLATPDVYTMATRGHHGVVLPSLHN